MIDVVRDKARKPSAWAIALRLGTMADPLCADRFAFGSQTDGIIGLFAKSPTEPRLNLSDTELKRALLEHLEPLRRFCFSLTGSAADGDDLAQGTVELLLRKGVPGNVPFLPWMFRVCKNHWIDGLRHRSRTQTASADELERHQGAVDGEAEALRRLQVDEVTAAVDQLDADQRLVLGLVTVQGFSYREAAELLDIPIGTVMSRLSRARKRLLELL